MQTWFRVPGYDHVEVTRGGRVRSVPRTIRRATRWGTEATFNFKSREYYTREEKTNGYVRVAVLRKGKRAPIYVHRLVARAFVDGFVEGYHVNHINGKKNDNRPENLEWVPVRENLRHARETGLSDLRGEKNPMHKLTATRVRAIRRLLTSGSLITTVALAAGVSRRAIAAIADGSTWQSIPD